MSTGVTVREVGEGAEAVAWDAFARAAPEATFFHLSGWRAVIEGALGHKVHLTGAFRGQELVGIAPLVHCRSALFGRSLTSMGFLVYGGIVAEDAAAREALARGAVELGRKLGVDHVEFRHRSPILDWTTKSELYATFRKALPEAEDDNLKAIPRKKRADVRKGIKLAPKVDPAASVETFYRLYSESLRNLGTPVQSLRFYRAIKEVFGDEVEISAVHGPGGPVAALMSFFFRDEVLPYYGGANFAARKLHAYDYMYWTLMRRGVARGARVFDFGRSKRDTGAWDYKTYWGFEPTPLHYQFHLLKGDAPPDVNPLNPKYRLMVKTWKRLPLGVANGVGPWIARGLA